MLNKIKINAEIGFSNSLKNLVSAYQEISAIRMRKLKKSVLDSRDYLGDLRDLYNESLSFYRNYTLKRTKGTKNVIKDAKVEKSLLILISSNTGLYGPVLHNTFSLFIKDLKSLPKESYDIVILGRLGKRWFDDSDQSRAYKYYEINDYGKNEIVIQRLLNLISSYKNVAVYHGFFESVSNQKPTRTILSGEAADFISDAETTKKSFEYCIYEPSIGDVIDFFESQILSVLFDQTMVESDLGKYASRMITLENSYSQINDYVKKLSFARRRLKSKDFNSRQQNLLSTVISWK